VTKCPKPLWKLRPKGNNLLKIHLKVIPCSSSRKLEYCKDGTLKIYLCSAPEKGRANSELIEYLAKKAGVSKSAVMIERGVNSRRKLVSIRGISKADFEQLVL